MEDIRFYCGLSHKYWNFHLCDPGPFACISPVTGRGRRGCRINSVYVPPGTLVFQDSGAFAEPLSSGKHLTFDAALKRQEDHAERYHYADSIAYRASYDLLVDHRFAQPTTSSPRRSILRCSPADGEESIEVTAAAARFLDKHRNGYHLALNVQGVTPEQYLRCVKQVVPLLRDGDTLGLGAWCVLGRKPGMMGDFLETLSLVIPFLAREGVPRVHLYGCMYTPAIVAILAICDGYGIALSLDSAYPSYAPCLGNWGYGSWRKKKYKRPWVLITCPREQCEPGFRCRGFERIRHVRLTREWLANFRTRERRMIGVYARNLDQYALGQILDLDVDEVMRKSRVRVTPSRNRIDLARGVRSPYRSADRR